uniref:Reverse transcriptase domain-containing protein n=1 Tax=Nicotiana tabacum TaxID=4097 RepID=A0A1S4D2A2_TOBAC|nr:PREDICTED: uncharacterized protein LOC107825083 [Nicotiana tabacum]
MAREATVYFARLYQDAGASKADRKHHSGGKTFSWIQLEKCDNPRRYFVAHKRRMIDQNNSIRNGIPLEVVVHNLRLDPNFPPLRKKKRLIAEVKNRFVKEENAGDTYQRLVNKMLENQIGKTLEVYIDDMLVKSSNAINRLKHLQETFDVLRKHNIKLNPKKCAFGVSSGKFLGFLISQRWTEVNPDNIKAIKDILDQLTSVKEVQRLTGRNVLHKLELSGRLAKWAFEISEFDIEYKVMNAIKSQVLAEFVADFSPGLMPLAAKEAVLCRKRHREFGPYLQIELPMQKGLVSGFELA